jgi:hypothetical protein
VITLKRCKEVLTKNGKQYTEEDIRDIRDIMVRLAEVDYNNSIKTMNNE